MTSTVKSDVLIEMLYAVNYVYLKRFIEKFYSVDLDDYCIKRVDEELGSSYFALNNDIFDKISHNTLEKEFRKYGWSIAKTLKDHSWIIPFENSMPNETEWDWTMTEEAIRKNKLFHISPKLLKNGEFIKPKASTSETAFENYGERIYLISEYLCEKNYKDTEEVINDLSEKLMKYHNVDIIYVYEVKIKDNWAIHADTAFKCGIYVKNPIKEFKKLKKIHKNYDR